MRVRLYKTGDEGAIAKIEKECFSSPWSEDAVYSEANSGSVFLVAEYENTIVGYISCRLILGEGYINNIAVTSSHRNKGIGKLLLSALIEQAALKNAEFLTLEVRRSNLPAQNLYRSFGFKDVGVRKNFYTDPTEDALLLTLTLGDKNEDSCD